MFKECSNLEYVDISKIDLSKVSSTREMFNGCTRLKDIGIKEIDLRGGGIIDCTDMFRWCHIVNRLKIIER